MPNVENYSEEDWDNLNKDNEDFSGMVDYDEGRCPAPEDSDYLDEYGQPLPEDYDPTTPLTIDDFDEDWLKDELDDEDES